MRYTSVSNIGHDLISPLGHENKIPVNITGYKIPEEKLDLIKEIYFDENFIELGKGHAEDFDQQTSALVPLFEEEPFETTCGGPSEHKASEDVVLEM